MDISAGNSPQYRSFNHFFSDKHQRNKAYNSSIAEIFQWRWLDWTLFHAVFSFSRKYSLSASPWLKYYFRRNFAVPICPSEPRRALGILIIVETRIYFEALLHVWTTPLSADVHFKCTMCVHFTHSGRRAQLIAESFCRALKNTLCTVALCLVFFDEGCELDFAVSFVLSMNWKFWYWLKSFLRKQIQRT